ncbi:MAG: hypothetical protein ACOCVQ_00235 [Bacillota bacterium]
MSGDGQRSHDSWYLWFGLAAVIAVLAYLFVATSSEFESYSHVEVSGLVAKVAAFCGGAIASVWTGGKSGRLRAALLALVVFGPILVYAGLLVSLWSSVGRGLMDVIIFTAMRRALSMFITLGILTAFGAAAGLGVSGYFSRS